MPILNEMLRYESLGSYESLGGYETSGANQTSGNDISRHVTSRADELYLTRTEWLVSFAAAMLFVATLLVICSHLRLHPVNASEYTAQLTCQDCQSR